MKNKLGKINKKDQKIKNIIKNLNSNDLETISLIESQLDYNKIKHKSNFKLNKNGNGFDMSFVTEKKVNIIESKKINSEKDLMNLFSLENGEGQIFPIGKGITINYAVESGGEEYYIDIYDENNQIDGKSGPMLENNQKLFLEVQKNIGLSTFSEENLKGYDDTFRISEQDNIAKVIYAFMKEINK